EHALLAAGDARGERLGIGRLLRAGRDFGGCDRDGTPGVGHQREPKKPSRSLPGMAPARPSKRPSSAIIFAARMKPPQAARASAPPTLILRTPIASASFSVKSLCHPTSRFTGLGATAVTTAMMC